MIRALLLTVLVLAGCASDGPLPPPDNGPGAPAPPAPGTPEELRPYSMSAVARDYPLYAGDEIQVSIQGHPELTIQRKLPPDGKIPLYLGGDRETGEVSVMAAGKRVPELEAELRGHYSRVVSPPYVTVRVQAYEPKWVYVAGAVKTPNQYRLPDEQRISLVQALTLAGWFEPAAADDRVRIMRIDPATGRRFFLPPIDVRRIVAEADVDCDIALEPGDTITVDSGSNRSVFIFGHVGKPGEYTFETGMSLSRLITLAGGLKEFAKTTDIRVLRTGADGQPQVHSVDLEAVFDDEAADFLLMPGDVVRVDERFI